MNPIITLTTDFGLDDHFAGAMKGAILNINPEVKLVDITHGIPPHNIIAGALALKSAFNYFPPRTIHLVVVDPGVGGRRHGIIIVTEKYLFVGPDNGVMSLAVSLNEVYACYRLTATHYFRRNISPTFHGRDVFGPVAAWLSKGISCQHFGEVMDDIIRLSLPAPTKAPGAADGVVIHVDRFGNLITNITMSDVETPEKDRRLICTLKDREALIPFATFYGEVGVNEPCALAGSSGFIEIAVNQGRAADRFEARTGHPVRLQWS